MSPDILLRLMFAAYALPIAFVYSKYQDSAATTRSISSIITSQEPFISIADNNAPPPLVYAIQTRHFLAACMMLMACFTILYEYQRCMNSQWWSLAAILVLLIGIFGVIFIPEDNPIHYVFGGAVFFAMLGFMVGHTALATAATAAAETLRIILYAQILFMILTVIGLFQGAPIFIAEALFILNFAVFYVYLHFHTLAPAPAPSSSASSASSSSMNR
jgi:FtsH-binding integral membrane protein